MNELIRKKIKTKFRWWYVFLLPPLNGFLISLYIGCLFRVFWNEISNTIFSVDEEEYQRAIDFKLKVESHLTAFIVSFFIGVASLFLIGQDNAMNATFMTFIHLVYAPFTVFQEMYQARVSL